MLSPQPLLLLMCCVCDDDNVAIGTINCVIGGYCFGDFFCFVNDHLLNVVAGGFNNNGAVTLLLPHQRDRRCRYCVCGCGFVVVDATTNNCIVDDIVLVINFLFGE